MTELRVVDFLKFREDFEVDHVLKLGQRAQDFLREVVMLREGELSEEELQKIEHGSYDPVILVKIHVLREEIIGYQAAEIFADELEHMREVLDRVHSRRPYQHLLVQLDKMQHAVSEELLR